MSWFTNNTRTLQIAILGLLVTCFAQAAYWIVDQARYSRAVEEQMLELWQADVGAAKELLARGSQTADVRARFPHVAVSAAGEVEVDPEARAALLDVRDRRLNRYGWEGSFFLLVLLIGMGILVQTVRQRAELARRQQNFVAAVSHEFKSPLASLRLAAETIALRKPEGESLARLAGRMTDDVDRLSYMVTNILEAARIDEGRLEQRPEAVPLAAEGRSLADRTGCVAHLKQVQVTSEIPDELVAFADPAGVRTVLANLVDNAVKATAANGGGAVQLSGEVDGRGVRIEVRDEGLGFDAEQSRRLFEKFYRTGDELTRRTSGSGLGLYVVQQFVRKAGGHVTAESPGPGLGATFRVWWPAPPAEVLS